MTPPPLFFFLQWNLKACQSLTCFRVITFKMVHLCFWTILKRHFSLPQINPSSIRLNSSCFVSNLQLSLDLRAAEGLEVGHCLQPWHEHTDICHHSKQKSGGVDQRQQQSGKAWWWGSATHGWRPWRAFGCSVKLGKNCWQCVLCFIAIYTIYKCRC